MIIVKFSDDKEFKFTEYQIKYIPYFNAMLDFNLLSSNINNEFTILQNSCGFEFLHMFATLDEIDIIDPLDKYQFVLKQCDYFGYDKLKELIEYKYGFRNDITNVSDKIGTIIKSNLIYLGAVRFTKVNITPEGYNTDIWGINIEKVLDPSQYSTDSDINTIYVKRYEQNINEYYKKLFNMIFTNGEVKEIFITHYGQVHKYTILTFKSVWTYNGFTAVDNISDLILQLKSNYVIRYINDKKFFEIYEFN